MYCMFEDGGSAKHKLFEKDWCKSGVEDEKAQWKDGGRQKTILRKKKHPRRECEK